MYIGQPAFILGCWPGAAVEAVWAPLREVRPTEGAPIVADDAVAGRAGSIYGPL